jgi:hypothetical protein
VPRHQPSRLLSRSHHITLARRYRPWGCNHALASPTAPPSPCSRHHRHVLLSSLELSLPASSVVDTVECTTAPPPLRRVQGHALASFEPVRTAAVVRDAMPTARTAPSSASRHRLVPSLHLGVGPVKRAPPCLHVCAALGVVSDLDALDPEHSASPCSMTPCWACLPPLLLPPRQEPH